MRVRMLLALCLVAPVTFTDAAAADEPASIQRPHYQLLFPAAIRAEAESLEVFMQAAVEGLKRDFARHDAERLLAGVRCRVHLYDQPNDLASESTATARTSGSGEGPGRTLDAELHLLAPSAHSAAARTAAGLPKDENYFRKVFAHEFSTLLMEQILYTKPAGWRRGGPAWFVQGYQEYLGIRHSGERGRAAVFTRYVELTRGDRTRVQDCWGLQVRDDYVDGAVLLACMHAEFGAERVQAILASQQTNFGAAIQAELGLTSAEFFARWSTWLDRADASAMGAAP